MSRRTDFFSSSLPATSLARKEQEQQFLVATAELILCDLVDQACKCVEEGQALW